MNKKKLLLGSLSTIVIIGAGWMMMSDLFKSSDVKKEESLYEPRENNLTSRTGGKDMQEFLFSIKKNVETGELTHEDYQTALDEIKAMSFSRNSLLQWEELGPDNIGGRTRGIVVDVNDESVIYAGAVSGGLWKSTNSGNTWSQVTAFEENLGVSHLAQTADGTIYIATGHFQENSSGAQTSGYNGNGLYYTTDGGTTINHVDGTENYGIHKLGADTINNYVFMATSNGLKKYTAGGTVGDIAVDGFTTSFTSSLAVSKDGSLIVTNINSRTYVSKDGGTIFSNRSENTLSNPVTSTDIGRAEYAISHFKENGSYKIYASFANGSGRIRGIWVSENDGDDWYEIAPSYQSQTQGGALATFTPFSTSLSSQGFYNNVITVDPTNSERTIMGGIDLYHWEKAVSNPPFGSWDQISFWNFSPTSDLYVHADNHAMVWDKSNRLYIGNDGGVGVSDDQGQSFYPANRGYNVTQFYSLAFSAHGDVMGGTQDNGTLLNDFTMNTWQEFREVRGGDGFQSAISFRVRDNIYASIYYGDIERSSDRGNSWSEFLSDKITDLPGYGTGGAAFTFYTSLELYEDPFDMNSTDTVKFTPKRPYSNGEEVVIPSFSTGDSLITTLTQDYRFDDTLYYEPGLTEEDTIVGQGDTIFVDLGVQTNYSFIFGSHPMSMGDSLLINSVDTLVVDSINVYNRYYVENNGDIISIGQDTVAYDVAWDTIRVQDIRQSWMATGLVGSNGVWITREATRFQADPVWYKVADQYSGRVMDMEFSKDGEHLYVGTSSGQLWRVSGFSDVYASTPTDSIHKWIDLSENGVYPTKSKLTQTLIYNAGGPLTGIAVNPQDPENVMITEGGFGGSGKVRVSTTAASTTGTSSFVSKQGNMPNMPYYSAIIDRNDPDFGIVGTEFGVWATDELTSPNPEWVECNELMGRVPVFEIGQMWRTWDEGAKRPGEVYIATHGRGIFKSATLLNVPDLTKEEDEEVVSDNLKVFPNPLRDIATIEFELMSNTDVTVKVYNLNGRVVKEIREANRLAGTNQVQFNASDLPTGTYIVQMQAGNTRKTAKFIKTR